MILVHIENNSFKVHEEKKNNRHCTWKEKENEKKEEKKKRKKTKSKTRSKVKKCILLILYKIIK